MTLPAQLQILEPNFIFTDIAQVMEDKIVPYIYVKRPSTALWELR